MTYRSCLSSWWTGRLCDERRAANNINGVPQRSVASPSMFYPFLRRVGLNILVDHACSFQDRILWIYEQQETIREMLIKYAEIEDLEDILIISFAINNAAQLHEASGGRVLSYVPENLPLSKNFQAFVVGISQLRDQLEDIN
eukprot:7549649-Heterocapsa_arctica.AAC.1